MFSTKRSAVVVSILLLCLAAGQAMAADVSAKIDPRECDKPDYPLRWQSEGDSGNVLVAFLVGADGKVTQSKIVESSGSARVDRASARAGARCKFEPAAKNGQAAPSWAKVRYTWLLE
jgi:protein TonB